MADFPKVIIPTLKWVKEVVRGPPRGRNCRLLNKGTTGVLYSPTALAPDALVSRYRLVRNTVSNTNPPYKYSKRVVALGISSGRVTETNWVSGILTSPIRYSIRINPISIKSTLISKTQCTGNSVPSYWVPSIKVTKTGRVVPTVLGYNVNYKAVTVTTPCVTKYSSNWVLSQNYVGTAVNQNIYITRNLNRILKVEKVYNLMNSGNLEAETPFLQILWITRGE